MRQNSVEVDIAAWKLTLKLTSSALENFLPLFSEVSGSWHGSYWEKNLISLNLQKSCHHQNQNHQITFRNDCRLFVGALLWMKFNCDKWVDYLLSYMKTWIRGTKNVDSGGRRSSYLLIPDLCLAQALPPKKRMCMFYQRVRIRLAGFPDSSGRITPLLIRAGRPGLPAAVTNIPQNLTCFLHCKIRRLTGEITDQELRGR